MKAKIFTVILLCCLCGSAWAQVLTGNVVDSAGNGIDVFEAVLLRADSSLVNGNIFSGGKFSIRIDAKEIRLLKISSLEYEQRYVTLPTHTQTSSESTDTVNMGTIILTNSNNSLGEVSVTARRPVVKLTGSSYKVDVAESYLKDAGDFNDIMRRIPGVFVDPKGTIAVMGKPRLLVFLNGRQLRNNSELGTLKSSDIKSVEIDRNPSAAYSASSDAVIRITTVDAVQDYMRLVAYNKTSFSRTLSNRSTLSLKGKKERLNYFANTGFDTQGLKQYDAEDRNVWIDTDSIITHRRGTLWQRNNTFFLRSSLEYAFTPKHLVGIGYNMSLTNGDMDKEQDFTNISAKTSPVNIYSVSDNLSKTKTHNPFVFYIGNFGKNTLETYFDYYRSVLDNRQNITENGSNNVWQSFADIYSIVGAVVDLSVPTRFVNLRMGIKLSYMSDKGVYTASTKDEQHTMRTDGTHAGYLILSRNIKKFSLSSGLRAEHEYSKLYGAPNSYTDTTYLNFFPSLSIGYTGRGIRSNLSYSRRIYRPTYSQISPKNIYIDPLSYSVGNPSLQSTLVDIFSLSLQKGNLYLSLSHERYSNIRAQVSLLDTTTVPNRIKFTYANIPQAYNLKAYMMYSYDIKFLKGSLTALVTSSSMKYRGIIYAKPQDLSVYLKANAEATLWRGASVMLSLYYINSHYNNLIYSEGYFNTSLYVTQRLLKDNLTITIGAEDIFKTYNPNNWRQQMSNSLTKMTSDADTRYIGITLQYTYGRLQNKSKSKSSISDEERRLQ